MIFSTKALIYTAIATIPGLLFYWLFKQIGITIVGIILLIIFALIGFVIGTFKFPNIGSTSFTKKVSGEDIDDIIKRAIRFKMKKNKIYVYTKEEKE